MLAGGVAHEAALADHPPSGGTFAFLLLAVAGVLIFGLIGLAYLPMAITANSVFGFSFACANPAFIARSVWVSLGDYAVCATTFFLTYLAAGILERVVQISWSLFLVGAIPTTCIELYATAVQMRLLGMFFRYNQGRMGWLVDRG